VGLHRSLDGLRDLTEILAMRRAREESDARFRALFDCMPDATVVIRIVGEELTLLDWNETMEGIARSRLSRGRSVHELLRHHPTLLAEVRRCARDHTTLAREVAVPAPSSDSAYVLRLQHRFVAPNLMILVCEDVTEARRADGERTALLAAERAARIAAEEADARSQRLAHQLTTLQEDEFRRLARELHDEFGQELTALRVLLEVCAASESPRRETIVESERRVAGLLARVRALSHSLRPPVLDDLGLVEAVAWNVRRVGATTGLRVVFHPSNVERRFAPELELAAYRVVQEALTNVVRHAAAEAAEVRVWTVDETLFVEIRDAGSGFDSERTSQLGTSLGLAGMRERVESLRGTFVVESSVGQGTVVTAAFPLAEGPIA
jgi:signal transduction histidine kinase